MSTESTRPKKLAIIDGKSVFYRGYYAMPNLSTKDGTPTGGVFGFATMALEVIRMLKPDYVCVAWDKPKTNIRRRLELYPQYKAGRKPPPPDFYEQIPILHDLLEAFGWPLYELDDYEADDIMGTLAVQAREKGIETQLITSDLDLLQVINDQVHVYALKKGLSNIELYHPESFFDKYGINHEQFLDLKSLKGDSSDNIPGVPGIGEKGAVDLLQQFKTLDGIYENLDLIKETLRKKLESGKESAYLSKKLAAIWTDAPIKLNLSEVDGSKCDPERVRDVLQKLEFRSLVRQLPEVMRVQEQHDVRNIFEHGFSGELQIIETAKQLEVLSLDINKPTFVMSRAAGSHGKNPRYLALSQEQKSTFVLNLTKLDSEALQGVFAKPLSIIGYDTKNTIQLFLELGLVAPRVSHDVLVGAFLLNALRREQSLTELARADIGYDGSALEDLSDEEFLERAPEIVAIIRGLYDQQVTEIKEIPKLQKLAAEVEWPVIPVLARMEHKGIALDTEYLREMSVRLEDDISDIQQKIFGYADQEFNVSSPTQLADILFNTLQLSTQGIKKGKTGFSTAASELDKLRGSHPIIDLITEYREYTKLKNTYVDTLPTMVDDNSRLHTTFALTVAQTGRLSSNDPNLQNIPVRTDVGRKIRAAFVAGKGSVFVSADYSQFELRLAAYLANDTELIEMFNAGADIHTLTAAQVYDRDPEDVTKQMRRDAKVINFGILYGMSPHGLTVATGMSYEQSKHFIDRYYEIRKPLMDYMETIKDKARKDGYVETLFGRRRPMPDIHSSNFMVRSAAERAAINMPIQGTEADLMKMAMIKLDEQLPHETCSMLLQIHDSILVECPEEQAESVAQTLKITMESIYKLPVHLTVDTVIGKNWGDL